MPIIMSVCMCVPVPLCALYQEHLSKVRFVSRPLEVPLLRPINAGNHPITPSYPTITRPIRAKRSQGAGWICQGVAVSCFRRTRLQGFQRNYSSETQSRTQIYLLICRMRSTVKGYSCVPEVCILLHREGQ